MSHSHGMPARTKARSRAVDTLFEARIKGYDTDPAALRELAAQRREVSTAQAPLPDYAQEILEGVASHIADIDDTLATYSRAWSLDRMPPTDLSVLRVACWEILFNDDTEDTVAINEAIRVVKRIGTDKSAGFVNGVLDAIRKDK